MTTMQRTLICMILVFSLISLSFLPSAYSSRFSFIENGGSTPNLVISTKQNSPDYTDYVRISIEKHWIAINEHEGFFFSSQTVNGTPTPIRHDPDHGGGYSVQDKFGPVWVHGYHQNFGHRLGMILVKGAWVVAWRVEGTIDENCEIRVDIAEYWLPGFEYGRELIMGTEVIEPTTQQDWVEYRYFNFLPNQNTSSQAIEGPGILPGGVFTVTLDTYRVPKKPMSNEGLNLSQLLPRCHIVDNPVQVLPQSPEVAPIDESEFPQSDTVQGNVNWPSAEAWTSWAVGTWPTTPVEVLIATDR